MSEREFVEANLRLSRSARWRRTLIFGALAATFGLAAAMRSLPPQLLVWTMAITYAVNALTVSAWARYQLRRAFRARRAAQAVARVTLSADGYRVDSAGTELLIRWHAFSHYVETPTAFLLHLGPHNAQVLPKSALAAPHHATVRSLLQNYIGRTRPDTSPAGFPVAQPPPKSP